MGFNQFVSRFKKVNSKLSQTTFQLSTNKDLTKSIILAGMGRSGTTWVAQTISNVNKYRFIFEPLHRRVTNKEFKKQLTPYKEINNNTWEGLNSYLRPTDKNNILLNTFKEIFAGKIGNRWVDQYNRIGIYNKRLIKFIKLNLMLNWIYRNFKEIPIVILLRHPCAVVASQKRQNWLNQLNYLISQKQLADDLLSPFKESIKKIKDPFQMKILEWCILNYVPLKQFKKGEIHIAFYENFCTQPEQEVERLVSFVNKYKNHNLMKEKTVKSFQNSMKNHPQGGLNNWKNHVTKKQIKESMKILSIFGLDKIYTDEIMPNTQAAYDFLAK